jgi:hypothetical protein
MPEEKSNYRVAFIGGAAIVIAAAIAAIASVIAAKYRTAEPPPPPPPDIAYAGRVVDKQTQQLVKNATVYVDTRGETQRYYTGESGTFRVVLSPSTKAVRIRVEAQGYKVFNDPVAPAQRNELEDIRLEPTRGTATNLPGGMSLKDAIEFVARQEDFGIEYSNCDPKLLRAKVKSGPYHGADAGVVIDQLKNQLINPPLKSSYVVNKDPERKVYKIDCTN